MVEQALSQKQLVAELCKSPHGDLASYLPVARRTCVDNPDFYSHLIAWNHQRGQVRDAKVALPVVALSAVSSFSQEHSLAADVTENALAHLADLSPRMLLQALDFARFVKAPSRMLQRFVHRYLRDMESDYRVWERTALQHRETMRTLYGRYHIAPGRDRKVGNATAASMMDVTLMKGAAVVGKFAAVRTLSALGPDEIASTIKRYGLPYLIARGALGVKAKEPAVLAALIRSMSDAELVNNVRSLKRLGVMAIPEARAALEHAIERAGTKTRGKKSSTLKATKAAESLEASGDDVLAGKFRALQERQIDNLGGVDGDWLVLGDASTSMKVAIELARQVSAILARMVKGKVHLVFFNESPRYMDVTGKSYEEIKQITAMIAASGNTSIGCGLQYCVDKGFDVDGIAVISDGGQNRMPSFSQAYLAFEKKFDRRPTAYLYQTPGDTDRMVAECAANQIDLQVFDLRQSGAYGKVDYYSLPNLVQTMRTQRYSLVDEIYQTPLRTLDEVLSHTVGMKVVAHDSALLHA